NIHVANGGDAPASFAQGANVLSDNPPNVNINYGAVFVSPNTTNVTCTIDVSKNLTCLAGTGGLSVPAAGSFDVSFSATATAAGTFINPRNGNICKVDPTGTNGVVAESNESNNNCSDTVVVSQSNLRAPKVNNIGPATTLGNSWKWSIQVQNFGKATSLPEGA